MATVVASDPPPKARCTKAQRAAIVRANGALSRGPATAAGRERFRQARIRYGQEWSIEEIESVDLAAFAAALARWEEYYRPRSAAAYELIALRAKAEVVLGKCATFLESQISEQRGAIAWARERLRQQAVARHVELLATQPREAVSLLHQSGHGCRWLLAALNSDSEASRIWLRDLVRAQIDDLVALERALRTGPDQADFEEEMGRESLPRDSKAARQHLRCEGKWCTIFLRF
jgi:hypothetical protein